MDQLFRFRERQRVIYALERLRYKRRQPLPPQKKGWEHLPQTHAQTDRLIALYEERLREIDAGR